LLHSLEIYLISHNHHPLPSIKHGTLSHINPLTKSIIKTIAKQFVSKAPRQNTEKYTNNITTNKPQNAAKMDDLASKRQGK